MRAIFIPDTPLVHSDMDYHALRSLASPADTVDLEYPEPLIIFLRITDFTPPPQADFPATRTLELVHGRYIHALHQFLVYQPTFMDRRTDIQHILAPQAKKYDEILIALRSMPTKDMSIRHLELICDESGGDSFPVIFNAKDTDGYIKEDSPVQHIDITYGGKFFRQIIKSIGHTIRWQ